MTASDSQEPEGTTLNVYSYVVKQGKPVGPRDVMRGANLSSPSLAYWHLQKLENSGLTNPANISSKRKLASADTSGLDET